MSIKIYKPVLKTFIKVILNVKNTLLAKNVM